MRRTIAIALLAVTPAAAQTPPSSTPRSAQPATQRRAAAAPARAGMTLTVTDARGTRLTGVRVEAIGASDRSGDTDESGRLAFTGMQAGTYRLRFSGPSVVSFEREVTLRAGQVAALDVTLNEAPPPPAPPAPSEPAAPPAPVVGPAGEPRALSIVNLVERELIPSNEPRRETLVSCSGNTRTTLVQLNSDQPDRLYDAAEVTYYVIAGEGAVRIGVRETPLAAGTFVSVPRSTAHGVLRRGRRPLILLATLSGVPCEEPR